MITGAAGFAGRYLAEHLLSQGQAVLGCTVNGRWHEATPPVLVEQVPLVAWDLQAPRPLSAAAWAAIEAFRPQVVYHLAAVSVPADCGQHEPSPVALAVNVQGTQRVLELVHRLQPRPRVLLASTSHVYTPVGPDTPPLAETWPSGPITGYGHSKLLAEEALRQAIDQWGCDGVIARSFQHAGPRQSPRMMLPQWTRQFVLGGPEPVEVLTRQARLDLTDVRDVVRAYRLLAERGSAGAVYNVGAGKAILSGEVLDLLRSLTDPRRPIRELQPGPKYDRLADCRRLEELALWRPEIPVERTVSDTLAWWRGYLAPGPAAHPGALTAKRRDRSRRGPRRVRTGFPASRAIRHPRREKGREVPNPARGVSDNGGSPTRLGIGMGKWDSGPPLGRSAGGGQCGRRNQ